MLTSSGTPLFSVLTDFNYLNKWRLTEVLILTSLFAIEAALLNRFLLVQLSSASCLFMSLDGFQIDLVFFPY